MKNVLLFHLESVSNLIFRTNPDCFPNLTKFISESVFYPKYYSTATSTYMVITDMFFGDNMQFEKSNHVEDIFSIKPQKISAFDKLAEAGYNTKCYCFGFKAGEKAKKHVKVYCSQADCWESPNNIDEMAADMRSFFSRKEPFAVFVQDFESHWMNLEAFSDGIKSSYDLFTYKYKKLDETFGMVLNQLKRSGKYHDTLIIAYGDHGDDLWGHGLHEGYTHAIEPFPVLVHCPLVIKNGPCLETGRVWSTIDIHGVILSVIEPKAIISIRDYAVARNLFSGQMLCEDSFNKSYMVTDGRYSLLVSARGLRLYCNGIDPTNGRNMLDFFMLNDGNLSYNKLFYQLKSSHYKFFMTEKQIDEFKREFKILLKELKAYLAGIYGDSESKMNFAEIDYADEIRFGDRVQSELKKRAIWWNFKSIIKGIIGYNSK